MAAAPAVVDTGAAQALGVAAAPGEPAAAGRRVAAGTATIAADSGGDTMQISDASALEDTLARLRQRYALHYYLPEGSRLSDQRTVLVTLSQDAKRRYQEAEVRYRRVYMAGNNGERSGPTAVTHTRPPVEEVPDPAATTDSQPAPKRRRVAVNEDTNGPRTVEPEPQSSSPAADPAPAQPAPPPAQSSPPA